MERVAPPSYAALDHASLHSFRIPSSVLLFGEYCITQRGGLGLGMPGEESAWVHISTHETVHVLTKESSQESVLYIVYTRESSGAQLLQLLDREKFDALRQASTRNSLHSLFLCCTYTPPGFDQAKIRSLWEACLESCFDALTRQGAKTRLHLFGSCSIDTSAFFHVNNSSESPHETSRATQGLQKKGLSSSACSCLAICACIWTLAKRDPLEEYETFSAIAIRAHSRFQGGGSGYDVLTSYIGKTLLFLQKKNDFQSSLETTIDHTFRASRASRASHTSRASRAKQFFAEQEQKLLNVADGISRGVQSNTFLSWIDLPRYFTLRALKNLQPVQTEEALRCFREFGARNPELVLYLLQHSNASICALVRLLGEKAWHSSEQMILLQLQSLQCIGELIGECISVPATIPDAIKKPAALYSDNTSACFWKALGAGNESIGLLQVKPVSHKEDVCF